MKWELNESFIGQYDFLENQDTGNDAANTADLQYTGRIRLTWEKNHIG